MKDDGVAGPGVLLVILDGWGLREPASDNAISQARTPTWDQLWSSGRYPRATLQTSGRAVGLPDGQMGNSEVGHLNLGAGRVVSQSILRISDAIRSGDFFRNDALQSAVRAVKERGSTLHLMGLLGPGGVHAVDDHLHALLDLAAREDAPRVRLHLFLDGRDTPPKSARGYLTGLLRRLGGDERVRIATLAGRYFGMDRDRRWERTRLAYQAVLGRGAVSSDPVQALEQAYAAGETDEFVTPRVLVDRGGEPVGVMREGDVVIFFNFRADRARQLCRALAEDGFDNFATAGRPRVELVTLTEYDSDFSFPVAFPALELRETLADALADHGLRGFRTAETEKYPHVTYFFNGGWEDPPAGEERRLVPSPKVATYDLQPEMSAPGVTDGLLEAVRSRRFSFLLCNYANPDMVGHTGVLEAAVRAVEAVDQCVGRVLAACRETGTTLLVSADHGNCEQMYDPETGGPHTAHTTNPVGILLVEPEDARTAGALEHGALCDVAPTVLGLLDVPQPTEMTGRDLRRLSG